MRKQLAAEGTGGLVAGLCHDTLGPNETHEEELDLKETEIPVQVMAKSKRMTGWAPNPCPLQGGGKAARSRNESGESKKEVFCGICGTKSRRDNMKANHFPRVHPGQPYHFDKMRVDGT